MTQLPHDRFPAEGPVRATARQSARDTAPLPSSPISDGRPRKATQTVPTQRAGDAPPSGTAPRTPRAEAAPPGLAEVADLADLTGRAEVTALEGVRSQPAVACDPPAGPAGETAPATARVRLRRLVTPPVRRRPAFYLAAALAGAVGFGLVSTGGPAALADGSGRGGDSVSVAEELGIDVDTQSSTVAVDATEQLQEMTASRTAREAEQAAAAQAQADADRLAAEAAAEAARPDAVAPVAGARLTSGFGARWGTLHAGIDLAAPMLTPEYAAMDGVVLEAGPASGYGNVVYIQHQNGDVTVYGHMEEILVTAGQVVRAGDTIALLGNRGQSTGPHLHFEVHVGGINGQKIDPVPWLQERGVAV